LKKEDLLVNGNLSVLEDDDCKGTVALARSIIPIG
jgi:hypothetical protein